MNLEDVGVPVALVKYDGDKKKTKVLSIERDKSNVEDYLKELKLTKPKESIQHIPNKKTERQILYITGASGSGKSFYTKHYCDEYRRMFPKNAIYLISSISEDSSIDKVKGLKRIKLSNELLTTDLKADDFKDSLVIFDDTDCLTNKIMRMKVNGILNMLLETGRHTNTSVIYTSHLATAGLDTKRILNEAHSITIFPHSLGGRSLKYLLENYFGLDKHQIKKIKTLPSRWVTLIKSFPMVVLSEKEAYVLNLPDEKE
jgi:hypothetical protein|uniref:ATPase domain containing protein n=1 Tax=viral metagenome TaxID=1070528 RepID=A0A6C0AIY6_9ZZZZ